MTQKVENGTSLKRLRELSPSNNIRQHKDLKKRKSEKLKELFGDAILPDLQLACTGKEKSLTSKCIQTNDDGLSSTSGIGFLDALHIVTSGNNKKNSKHHSKVSKPNKKENKDDENNNKYTEKKGNENHKVEGNDKQRNKWEGIRRKSNENISKYNLAAEEEITSSSGVGFAEALEMTSIIKSKTKKKRKHN